MTTPDMTEWMCEQNTNFIRDQIRKDDESSLGQRVARAIRTKVHFMIPHEWFDVASSECRDLFRDGHFNGCICLAQAVGEGLVKFLVRHHPTVTSQPGKTRADRLCNGGYITEECRQAFLRIRGNDRNDFHHLNDTIITDPLELERRAEECVMSLYEIESEIFKLDISISTGAVVPRHPEYWPKEDPTHLKVFVRRTY